MQPREGRQHSRLVHPQHLRLRVNLGKAGTARAAISEHLQLRASRNLAGRNKGARRRRLNQDQIPGIFLMLLKTVGEATRLKPGAKAPAAYGSSRTAPSDAFPTCAA